MISKLWQLCWGGYNLNLIQFFFSFLGHYVLAVDNPAPAGLAADVEIKDYAFLASPGLHVLDDGACFSFDFYLNGDGAALHLVMKRGEEGSPVSCESWILEIISFMCLKITIYVSSGWLVTCFKSSPPGQHGRHFGRRHFQMNFLWMKTVELQFKFHWNLFPSVQLIINQHWFR